MRGAENTRYAVEMTDARKLAGDLEFVKLDHLRRMADRNVSYALLLETALLESERAGIQLEDLIRTE